MDRINEKLWKESRAKSCKVWIPWNECCNRSCSRWEGLRWRKKRGWGKGDALFAPLKEHVCTGRPNVWETTHTFKWIIISIQELESTNFWDQRGNTKNCSRNFHLYSAGFIMKQLCFSLIIRKYKIFNKHSSCVIVIWAQILRPIVLSLTYTTKCNWIKATSYYTSLPATSCSLPIREGPVYHWFALSHTFLLV